MLNFSAQASSTLICGPQGCGKTSFAIRYLLNSPSNQRFIFDPQNEFSRRLRLRPCLSSADLNLSLLRGWTAYDPSAMFAGDRERGFAFFAAWAFKAAQSTRGRKLFLLDELETYASSHSLPAELRDIVVLGRKLRLEFIGLCHRPNAVHGTIVNEATESVIFGLRQKAALDVVEDVYGIDRDEIASLAPMHFVSRSNRGSILRGKVAL